MRIEGIIWLRDVVDKLVSKHQVETYEVEEVLNGKPAVGWHSPCIGGILRSSGGGYGYHNNYPS